MRVELSDDEVWPEFCWPMFGLVVPDPEVPLPDPELPLPDMLLDVSAEDEPPVPPLPVVPLPEFMEPLPEDDGVESEDALPDGLLLSLQAAMTNTTANAEITFFMLLFLLNGTISIPPPPRVSLRNRMLNKMRVLNGLPITPFINKVFFYLIESRNTFDTQSVI